VSDPQGRATFSVPFTITTCTEPLPQADIRYTSPPSDAGLEVQRPRAYSNFSRSPRAAHASSCNRIRWPRMHPTPSQDRPPEVSSTPHHVITRPGRRPERSGSCPGRPRPQKLHGWLVPSMPSRKRIQTSSTRMVPPRIDSPPIGHTSLIGPLLGSPATVARCWPSMATSPACRAGCSTFSTNSLAATLEIMRERTSSPLSVLAVSARSPREAAITNPSAISPPSRHPPAARYYRRPAPSRSIARSPPKRSWHLESTNATPRGG